MKEKQISADWKIITTADGSHTISIPSLNVYYHSVHGAIQESKHVFLDAGFNHVIERCSGPIHIFEMGFGTGLNAFLTAMEAEKQKRGVQYTTIEKFPFAPEAATKLNYPEVLGSDLLFQAIHNCDWNREVFLTPHFTLHKVADDISSFVAEQQFDLVYFDAFAPSAQPDLWTADVFTKLFTIMGPGAVFVTYCSKGSVQRAIQSAGFKIEKLPGPKYKREIIRARRIS